MNKKGFTIVELLVVIMIIGIIAVIGGVSVNSISKIIKERQYNNLIKTIYVASKNYKEDTGLTQVYVKTLIEQGYLSADDDKGNIYSPKDSNIKLNCFLVDMSEEEYSINTEIFQDKNGMCPNENVISSPLKICIYKNDGTCEVVLDNWYGSEYVNDDSIKLGYQIVNGITINNEESKWVTLLAPDNVIKGKDINISLKQGYVKATYNLTAKSDVGKYYDASATIKVDGVKPQIVVDNDNLIATLSDNESGLQKYCINDSNCKTITGNDYQISSDNFPINGQYTIVVYDNADNISTNILTNETEKPAPTIEYIKIDSKISDELQAQNVNINMLATSVTMEVTDTVGDGEVAELCITKTNDINTCEYWQSVNAVNKKYTFRTSYILGTEYDGSTYNLYGFARYKIRPEKVDDEKSNDYTIYKLCTNTTVAFTMNYNPCRAGQKTEVYTDKYFLNSDCGTKLVDYPQDEDTCCSETTRYATGTKPGPPQVIFGQPGKYPTFYAIYQDRSDYDTSYQCGEDIKKGPMLYAGNNFATDNIEVSQVQSYTCPEICSFYCANPNNSVVSQSVKTSNCWPCNC